MGLLGHVVPSMGSLCPSSLGSRLYATDSGEESGSWHGFLGRAAENFRAVCPWQGCRAARADNLPVDKNSACGSRAKGNWGDHMPNSQMTPGIAPGRLQPEDYARNFGDLYPPYDATRRRWRRTAAISATTRPASRPAPRRSTSRCSSARSRRATPRAAKTILRPEHPRRHVRPRLPDRDAVRGGLRARGGRGQAGRDRAAPALCDRQPDGEGHPSVRARRAHGQARGGGRGGARGARLRAPARDARP
jgi:hypothetical protein